MKLRPLHPISVDGGMVELGMYDCGGSFGWLVSYSWESEKRCGAVRCGAVLCLRCI